MLQRLIGFVVGGLVIYVMLMITDATSANGGANYLLSIVVGLVAAWFWPIVIGIFFARRAKERRDDKIEAEVQRQLAEERSKSNPS